MGDGTCEIFHPNLSWLKLLDLLFVFDVEYPTLNRLCLSHMFGQRWSHSLEKENALGKIWKDMKQI